MDPAISRFHLPPPDSSAFRQTEVEQDETAGVQRNEPKAQLQRPRGIRTAAKTTELPLRTRRNPFAFFAKAFELLID
jgi:hypothetical protein